MFLLLTLKVARLESTIVFHYLVVNSLSHLEFLPMTIVANFGYFVMVMVVSLKG